MENRILCLVAPAVALFIALTSVHASDIAAIEAQPSGTVGLTVDSNPVVTAILAQPGTVNGRTYANWTFLINDGTGSMEIFASGAALGALGYTPAVGDIITATGTYAPYHQIPALESLTAIGALSHGNPVPPPLVRTVADVNQSPLPMNLAGYMIQLDNVTIAGQGATFGINDGPPGATITDGTGSMIFWYWPSSCATANANLFGQTVPTGPVDMTGYLSVYDGVAEFHPVVIVPEPVTLALPVLCALALLRRRGDWRRRGEENRGQGLTAPN